MTATHDLQVTEHSITDLQHYHDNPRLGDVATIAESLAVNGQFAPIVINAGSLTGRHNEVLKGNHTLKAAQSLGWQAIKTVTVDVDDEAALKIVLADNRSSDHGVYDDGILANLLVDLPDLEGTGYTSADLDELLAESREAASDAIAHAQGDDTNTPPAPTDLKLSDSSRDIDNNPDTPAPILEDNSTRHSGALAARFGVPPFTVIDTRQGSWTARAREWKTLGIESELGRSEGLVFRTPQMLHTNWYPIRNAAREQDPNITDAEIEIKYASQLRDVKTDASSSTSIFDPALAETLTSWFTAPGMHVIDPWAGGSVRGVVTAALGRDYTGIELRAAQVEANRAQWETIAPKLSGNPGTPEWIEGESSDTLGTLDGQYDFAIGCPPYYDLERYSDDPRDLSTLKPAAFDTAMHTNIAALARVLKPDTFAAFTVGAVREKNGHLLDMKTLMIAAAESAGLRYINDIVLLNHVGSKAMGAARGFTAARTLGRVHQDVVIFVKGDRKKATKKLGDVDLRVLDTLTVSEDTE